MSRACWLTFASAALVAACSPPRGARPCDAAVFAAAPALPGEVFAELGGVRITDAQLMAFEDLDPAAAATGALGYPQLLAKVEDRVRFELLAQAAAARQLASSPEVVEATRKAMVRKLLAEEFAAERLGANVDEAVLRDYYLRHEADFLRPEARRFALLRFANDPWGRAQAEAFARGWHAEADDAPRLTAALRVAEPTPLPRGARRRRRPRNQPHWQNEPFLARPDVARRHGDEVADAVFAAPPLQFPVALVQTQRGAVAVRVLARRQGVVRPYAEARAEILEQSVRRGRTEKFAAYLDGLRMAQPLTVYEERMRAWLAHPPAPKAAPARAPVPVPPSAALARRGQGPSAASDVGPPTEASAPPASEVEASPGFFGHLRGGPSAVDGRQAAP